MEWQKKKNLLIFKLEIVFTFFFLAVVGLQRSAWAFSSCGKHGLPLVAMQGLLIEAVSPVVEHRLWRVRASFVVAHRLWSTNSVVEVHGLRCSTTCGIFQDQGLNQHPLHCKADS